MLAHELQNLREPTGASDRTVDPFQFGADVAEARKELPVPERGTGVANRFCTALTVPSASGFSLPRAGMQKCASKT
jgi:hypothetical protein